MPYTVIEFLHRLDEVAPDRKSYVDGESIRGYIRRGTLKASLIKRPAANWGRYEIPDDEVNRVVAEFQKEAHG